jgi:ankyrin repeat protein
MMSITRFLLCFLSVIAGSLDVCRALIKFGADVSTCTLDGTTPFCVACEEGHIELVAFLLKASEQPPADGAPELRIDIEARSDGRFAPLYQACRNGHLGTAQLLCTHKADVEAADPSDASTPLYIAASEGHVEVVQLLHSLGADAMAEAVPVRWGAYGDGGSDGDGGSGSSASGTKDTAYLAASRNGHMAVVNFLTHKGCTGGALHPYDAAFLDDLYTFTDGAVAHTANTLRSRCEHARTRAHMRGHARTCTN